MISDEKIMKIVEDIYSDVIGRRGIKQEFWKCDTIVIGEIKQSWFDIIKEGLIKNEKTN